jgi:hypothetical protein
VNGRIVGGVIVGSALIAGAAIYWLQVYAFYRPVAAVPELGLTTLGGAVEMVPVEDFRAIDADSSPLRFRACFRTTLSLATLTESFRIAADAVPLNGPHWFDCYDAAEVGAALASGDAVAFVGEHEIRSGVDRIVAIARDGRGWAWHQLAREDRDVTP